MNAKLIEDVAAAVLYEGYLLYPYRASAVKNQQRWTFGVLYPRSYAERQTGADAWTMQTECLLRASPDAMPQVRVRFLHLIARAEAGQAWQGAMEREVSMPPLRLCDLARAARLSLPRTAGEGQEPRARPWKPPRNPLPRACTACAWPSPIPRPSMRHPARMP